MLALSSRICRCGAGLSHLSPFPSPPPALLLALPFRIPTRLDPPDSQIPPFLRFLATRPYAQIPLLTSLPGFLFSALINNLFDVLDAARLMSHVICDFARMATLLMASSTVKAIGGWLTGRILISGSLLHTRFTIQVPEGKGKGMERGRSKGWASVCKVLLFPRLPLLDRPACDKQIGCSAESDSMALRASLRSCRSPEKAPSAHPTPPSLPFLLPLHLRLPAQMYQATLYGTMIGLLANSGGNTVAGAIVGIAQRTVLNLCEARVSLCPRFPAPLPLDALHSF